MSKINLKKILTYGLVVFFIVGAVGNLIGPEKILEDYARWGYPNRFHLLTGSFELLAAILIFKSSTRFIGSLLASCIMFSAILTLSYHAEYLHAFIPLIVFMLLLVSIYLHKQKKLL